MRQYQDKREIKYLETLVFKSSVKILIDDTEGEVSLIGYIDEIIFDDCHYLLEPVKLLEEMYNIYDEDYTKRLSQFRDLTWSLADKFAEKLCVEKSIYLKLGNYIL